jgi:hypothetical protein
MNPWFKTKTPTYWLHTISLRTCISISSLIQTLLVFFASYNKVGIAPVKTQFEELRTLVQLKMTGSVIKIIQPIKNNEDVLRYVYLRASTEALENRIFQSIMIIVSMSFANMFFSNLKVAKCDYRSD